MEPADVLPLSENLHQITGDWPAAASSLIKLEGIGKSLDEARRLAGDIGLARPAWIGARQPVGILYREEGVASLLEWVEGVAKALPAGDAFRRTNSLRAVFLNAAAGGTPLLRLYRYAEEAPEEIVTIVSARKAFVFWETEMKEGSEETCPDLGVLWESGGQPGSRPADSWRARRARSYERAVRELRPDDRHRARQIQCMERLLAREAEIAPAPSPGAVLPTRAEILWRPRRLELIDVARLARSIANRSEGSRGADRLQRVAAFIESARLERADLLLDAYCTDSPEAI